jgi:hypothetical protein
MEPLIWMGLSALAVVGTVNLYQRLVRVERMITDLHNHLTTSNGTYRNAELAAQYSQTNAQKLIEIQRSIRPK